MKVGDLIKWESVKNDHQEEFDIDYGIILEFRQWHDQSRKKEYIFKVLIQFYDEAVWLPVNSIQIINEQQ
jgi:hypothetical protein